MSLKRSSDDFSDEIKPLEVRRFTQDIMFLWHLINVKVDCPELLERLNFRMPAFNTRSRAPFAFTSISTSYGANSTMSRDGPANPEEVTAAKQKLQSWINKHMKIEMTDGRILIGMFLCTDRDGNVILGSCSEYLNPTVCGFSDEPRLLGLVMVPGRHIVSIHFDNQLTDKEIT